MGCLRRPNILFLHTDQQRWDALGANGNAQIRTPVLDRLAQRGINFDHCFVQNPVCMPSRISMWSGQYPATLGILSNGVPVPERALTLPRVLHPYGYRCAAIGKLHFLPHANRDHRVPHPDYGFDSLEISDEPGCYEDAYRAWVRTRAPDQLDSISVGLPPAAHEWQRTMGISDGIVHRMPGRRFDHGGAIPFPADEALTHSAFVAERTIDFLRTYGDRPFLCASGFYSPHSPWVVPQTYLDLYDREELPVPALPSRLDQEMGDGIFSESGMRSATHGYYAMVSEVDHQVGRILAALGELGLRRQTIVVFTSDHGEWLGEHLRYGKGYPAHDCVSRVPLIIDWPGHLPDGVAVQAIVEAVDILPTLLDLAAIQAPPHLQGTSLLSHLDGRARAPRESALTEMEGAKSLRLAGLRYVVDADGREALYDLRVDPGAYENVAGGEHYTCELAAARRELIRRLIARERPRPRAWAY